MNQLNLFHENQNVSDFKIMTKVTVLKFKRLEQVLAKSMALANKENKVTVMMTL